MNSEILNESQLINLVTEKHKNLLQQYTQEYEQVKNTAENLNLQAEKEKQANISRQERKEVLKEKKTLLFYQAGQYLKQLLARPLKTDSNNDLMQIIKTLKQKQNQLTKAKDLHTETTLISEIKTELEKISPTSETEKIIQLIHKKLKDATLSHEELENLNKIKEETDNSRETTTQLKELNEKQRWLERRINSHKNAQIYWEEQQNKKTGDKQ